MVVWAWFICIRLICCVSLFLAKLLVNYKKQPVHQQNSLEIINNETQPRPPSKVQRKNPKNKRGELSGARDPEGQAQLSSELANRRRPPFRNFEQRSFQITIKRKIECRFPFLWERNLYLFPLKEIQLRKNRLRGNYALLTEFCHRTQS